MSRNALSSLAIATVAAFNLCAAPGAAQARPRPDGVRVRVRISDSARVIGELGVLRRDSLTVRPVGGIEVRLLQPRSRDVERSAGQNQGAVWLAGSIGFFAGLAYGHQGVRSDAEEVEAVGDLFVAVPMGLLTAGLAATVAAIITGERWAPENFSWDPRGAPRPAASRQVRVQLDSGTTVRAVEIAYYSEVVGRLLSIDADFARIENGSGVHTVSRSTLRTFDVKGEKDKRTAALIWGGVAFGVTTLLAANDLKNDKIPAGEAIAAVAGNALIFGMIGAWLAPTHWDSVPCWLSGNSATGNCEVALRSPSARPPR